MRLAPPTPCRSVCQPCPFLGVHHGGGGGIVCRPHPHPCTCTGRPPTYTHEQAQGGMCAAVCCVSLLSLGCPAAWLEPLPTLPYPGPSGLGRPKPHPGLGTSPTLCSQGRREEEEKAPQSESSIPALEDTLPLFFSLSLAVTSSPVGGPVTPRACREALPEDLTLASPSCLPVSLYLSPSPLQAQPGPHSGLGPGASVTPFSQVGWPGGEDLIFTGCFS